MSESLQISREGRVLLLALNRPERRNALNMDLCSALAAALEEAESDAGVGAVLLSANGKSSWAARNMHEVLSPGGGDINEVHERIFSAGIRMTKPLIAAVQGAALAGGTGLAANCHIVVAAEDATFGQLRDGRSGRHRAGGAGSFLDADGAGAAAVRSGGAD